MAAPLYTPKLAGPHRRVRFPTGRNRSIGLIVCLAVVVCLYFVGCAHVPFWMLSR